MARSGRSRAVRSRASIWAPRIAAVATLACAAYLLWLPEVAWLKRSNPRSTAYIDRYVERERSRGKRPRVRLWWKPLPEISEHLRRAVVLSEDDLFYSHRGVDWDSVQDAIEYDWRLMRFARGGSTITQQVARNLFLSSSKNPLRKLKEMLIAWRLERTLGKRRILEIYLNIAEWGDGIYGAQAACRAYFGKSAVEIGPEEAAALATALPSPRRWNPAKKPGTRLARRREALLERMRKAPAGAASGAL